MVQDHRRLAAIVAADVVGYSLLMGRDESGTLAALKAHRRELIDPKIAEHGGRIVKTTGDGLLLEFPSVVDAVRCAVDVQRGMAERNAGIHDERRIRLRIGINVGDIIIDEEDIFGDGVNVAARLEGLAEPDGICVSRAVRDQVLDKLGFTFEAMGPRQVKNIVRPVDVYRIALDGGQDGAAVEVRTAPVVRPARRMPRAAVWAAAVVIGVAAIAWVAVSTLRGPATIAPYSAQDRRMTFAVLPFEAPTNDAEAKTVATALTDELRARQEARPIWARVASRRSVDETITGKASVEDIASALGVHFLMRGTVSRTAAGYSADVMVVDGATGRVLATRSMAVPPGPLVESVQEELEAAAGGLTFRALEAEVERARAKPEAALDVRDLAFRAYVVWGTEKGRGDELGAYTQAMALLDRALKLAPDDRLALRLVATVNLCECVEGWSRNVAEQQEMGEAALERYLRLDPDSLPMQAMKYQLLVAKSRYEDALLLAQTMARRDARHSGWLAMQAHALLKLGRAEEALAASDQARRRLDDWDRLMLAADIHYALGQDEPAAQLAQKALLLLNGDHRRSSRYGTIPLTLAAAQARLGRHDRAKAALADFHGAVPQVKTIADLRKWIHPAANLATHEPLYEGLRRAGLPE